jgi:hypothetical protein
VGVVCAGPGGTVKAVDSGNAGAATRRGFLFQALPVRRGFSILEEVTLNLLTAEEVESAKLLAAACYQQSSKAGWWHDPETGKPHELTPERFAQKLCLIHSEISEAMEGHRKGLVDDKLPHREMVEVELADAVIRIFDLAGRASYDVIGAMVEKLAYNAERADHKPENRVAAGGKKY